jgi:hypothetical protein
MNRDYNPTPAFAFLKPYRNALITLGTIVLVYVWHFHASPGTWGKPVAYLTGQVLDADTKQPLEGAYVLASYEVVRSKMFLGSVRRCVKTLGMTTAKDGAFRFPVEDAYNNMPHSVYAIKPDYYTHLRVFPSQGLLTELGIGTNSERHVYLKRQDAADPSFQHGFRYCEEPVSSAAVESAVKFLEIARVEETKYGKDPRSIRAGYELMEFMRNTDLKKKQKTN